MSHTASKIHIESEPWIDGEYLGLWSSDHEIMVGTASEEDVLPDVRNANARRLAESWNACLNIPIEAIADGVVSDLLALLQRTLVTCHFSEDPGLAVDIEKLICKATGKPYTGTPEDEEED